MTDFTNETNLILRGHVRVVGVDEVGRGPLAGPVTAAAVWLDPEAVPEGINDSKVLTARKREDLARQIEETCDVSIAHATVDEIDRMNILGASMEAMRRAIAGLRLQPDAALIDGHRVPDGLPFPAEALVKGDARCLSIAAASIVAKVARDKLMVELAQQYPGYGWERNAGYGTKEHQCALRDLGVTPHHRRSFAPVRNILYQGQTATG